jgi:nicotinamidase-related amidase
MVTQTTRQLPIPSHFDAARVGEVWRVPYQELAGKAKDWAKQHDIPPASEDKTRIGLLLIDVQNTFCLPNFELFVAGQSGMGAVEDNKRLCEFIYRHLGLITEITATMDTHVSMQIFHPVFWINDEGEHPPAMSTISFEDVEKGAWKVNPAVVPNVGKPFNKDDYDSLQKYALHYAKQLNLDSKYPLTIWPYHGKLGGIGHALVSAVEEALFFYCHARNSQTRYEIKGNNPLTENYSALQPEVLKDAEGNPIAQRNSSLVDRLLEYDALIITGQAKSHCVAWTISDLLMEIQARDASLAKKVYLLEDCTSPVVVPGVVDFTEQADATFQRCAAAGMHVVRSTQSVESWAEFPVPSL